MISNGRGATIESSLPGRVRMRLPRQERREDVLSEIESTLEALEGLGEITANLITGSVLVESDPDVLSPEAIEDMLRGAELIATASEEAPSALKEASWPGVSEVARNAIRGFKKFDHSVGRYTHGKIDGKMLIILLLLLTGIARALANGKKAATPWHTLIWYAYSAFMHWHNPTRPTRRYAR